MVQQRTKKQTEQCLLLVWELLPEEVKLYLIPRHEISDVQFSTLVLACGKIANCDDLSDEELTAVMHVNNALCEKQEHIDNVYEHPEFATNWAKYLVKGDKPIDKVITHVIRCGFLL